MINDHNRCEWVNVSSGNSSPSCPRQNPESRKMIVVVLSVQMKLKLLLSSDICRKDKVLIQIF